MCFAPQGRSSVYFPTTKWLCIYQFIEPTARPSAATRLSKNIVLRNFSTACMDSFSSLTALTTVAASVHRTPELPSVKPSLTSLLCRYCFPTMPQVLHLSHVCFRIPFSYYTSVCRFYCAIISPATNSRCFSPGKCLRNLAK